MLVKSAILDLLINMYLFMKLCIVDDEMMVALCDVIEYVMRYIEIIGLWKLVS